MKTDIKSLTKTDLNAAIKEMGEASFRGEQIFKWLHRGVTSFDEMTDLSKKLRLALEERFFITSPKIADKIVSTEGDTVKYLWRLGDGEVVESVLMTYNYGVTICVSSQVGCRRGCAFCASTIGGLVRDLTSSEILDQVIFSQIDSGKPIRNIVMMGIGEPLDNFENVLTFLEIVSDEGGLNIGQRRISLSTCAPRGKVDKLSEFGLQLTLSVSLHAPDDETRRAIMPAAKEQSVKELIDSCRRYFKKTRRRVSFEYALIDGVNDTREHANALSALLRGEPWHVNLILLNDVTERNFGPSKKENVEVFIEILKENEINATFRKSLGVDIDAACGQLRRSKMETG